MTREERVVHLDPIGDDVEKLFPSWTNSVAKEYRFRKQLGKGGFGQVWLATRNSDDKKLACKVIEKAKFKRSTLQSFHDEVVLMQTLRHPGIIKFHIGYETRKKLYLMIELCSGGELLAKIVSEQKISEKDCINYTQQILEVLKYVHLHGVVHCDLKPENVLFISKTSDQLKIIDFGLAKVHRHLEWISKVGGTPSYIAPECTTKHYTEACDVWATGVMAFEMLHGYLPFQSSKDDPYLPMQLAKKGLDSPQRGRGPHINTRYKLSEHAISFITSLLSVDPASRLTADEALLHPWITNTSPHDQVLDHVVDAFKIKSTMSNVQKFLKNMVHTDDMESWLIADMRRIFDKADTNQDGELDWDEFVEGMKELSVGMSEIDLINLFDAMDVDHNHSITIDEFLQQYAYQHAIKQDDRLWAICKTIDMKADGKLDADDVEKFVQANPEVEKGMTPQMRTSLANLFEEGSISYHTFICAMVEVKSDDLENTTDELNRGNTEEN